MKYHYSPEGYLDGPCDQCLICDHAYIDDFFDEWQCRKDECVVPPIDETVYVAVDKNNKAQWVRGSSRQTIYFRSTYYLNGAIERHNKLCPDNPWRIAKCKLMEVEE